MSKPGSSCLAVGAIVLAAGSASRMKTLKQVLPYGRRTLLAHAIEQAKLAELSPIVVVVGAQAAAVQRAVAHAQIDIAINAKWAEGPGTSISAGVAAIEHTDIGAVALLLGDQPLVSAAHLHTMRQLLFQSDCQAVAAEYSGTIGAPAFFKRNLFGRLKALPPASGAKGLLDAVKVVRFPLPEAATDIDTPEDWDRISKVETT